MGGAMKYNGTTGFTLIELLVVIAVVAILASLILATVGAVRTQGDRAAAVSNMRQIGSAVIEYAGDNDGRLPGPLWPGQVPYLDPAREGRLVRELDRYLSGRAVPESGTVDLFVPPAFRRVVGEAAVANSRTYVMNMEVEDRDGTVNPWGSAADPEPAEPMRLATVPAQAWGFSDADQLHPRVAPAPWSGNTPAEIVHGEKRLAWYFDGHVEGIEEEALELP
jgi:prepilin-type N-terminal cleavage/methylation domain-containing protein